MLAIREAWTAAAGLLGLAAVRGGTSSEIPASRLGASPSLAPEGAAGRPADPLAPCFEAVAAALRDAGLLA